MRDNHYKILSGLFSADLKSSSKSNEPVYSVNKGTRGFITCTGILVIFVSLVLLTSIAMLATQMWQQRVADSKSVRNISVSQSEIIKNIQSQKSLQSLQQNIKPDGVISNANTEVNEETIRTVPDLKLEADANIAVENEFDNEIFNIDPLIFNQTIKGRLLTSVGDILSGVTVTAHRVSHLNVNNRTLEDNTDVSRLHNQHVVSNSEGDFEFEHLQPGLYRISAMLDDIDSHNSRIVHSGLDAVDLVIPVSQAATINGQVMDEFGMPIEGVSVSLVPGKAQGQSDSLGQFSLASHLSEHHNYEIKFEAPNYEPAFIRISGASQLTGKSKKQISARMKSIIGVTTITGRITDIKGNLLPGQRVRLLSPVTNTRELVFTDQYGEFRFEQVIAGREYTLGVSPDKQYRPWIQRDIEITPASKYFELVLEPLAETGTLEGRIVDPSGNPVPNFSIIVKANAAGDHKIPVHSDQDGYFRVEDVPAGSLSLRTAAEPDLLLSNLKLQSGRIKQVIVPVDWGEQEFNGRLVDHSGKPVAGASVLLSWSQRHGRALSQTQRQSRTDTSGSFRFSNLGAGSHSLSISGTQIKPVSKQVEISTDNTLQRIVIQRKAT